MLIEAEGSQECPICGHSNSPDALFCAVCVAPLRVQPLADLSADDLRRSLDDVLQTVAEGRRTKAPAQTGPERELLHAYLSAFWLRPETALVQFAEARALLPLLVEMPAPFVDVGCGDGIHTSLLHGWRFAAEFDAYGNLDLDARDIFDAAPEEGMARIVAAGRRIDLGIDIKPTAVERARALGTFDRVDRADARELPLADGAAGTIYSNVIRDFGETLDAVLEECARVVRPGGCLVLASPTEGYQETLFYLTRARSRREDERELAMQDMRLDRGRSVFCRQQVPVDEWRGRLEAAGFELERVVPYATPPLMRFWDTGARPFSPALVRWAARLRTTPDFAELKQALVAAAEHLLKPLVHQPEPDALTGFRILAARRR